MLENPGGGHGTPADAHIYKLQSRRFASLLLYWNTKGSTVPLHPLSLVKGQGGSFPLFPHP